jgi:hypothetical protein
MLYRSRGRNHADEPIDDCQFHIGSHDVNVAPLGHDTILRNGHWMTDSLCENVVQREVATTRIQMLDDYESLVRSDR